MRLETRLFTPAITRAADLVAQLIATAEVDAQAQLDAPRETSSESFIERIRATRDLLKEFDPQNRYLKLFEGRSAELNMQADLRTWWEKARPAMTPGQLDEIRQRMKQINRDDPLTKSVGRMYDLRRLQTTSFDDGLDAFTTAWPEGLSRQIGTYEQMRSELPSSMADRELQQLRESRQWLDMYLTSPADLDSHLDQARLLHDELDDDILSWEFPEFVDAAREHLDALSRECERASARREGLSLCGLITDRCKRRLLDEATIALVKLKGLDVVGLDLEIAAAGELVTTLEKQEEDRTRWEEEFERFRGLLQQGKLGYARQTLKRLERAWGVEKDLLDAALDVEERDELRLRRAILNMRLGKYADASSDAERLAETGEVLLWRSLAGFAEAPDNPSGIREALADVARAIVLDGNSKRALYLRGIYRHVLLWLGEAHAFSLGDIRRDLEDAVSKLELDSATACYHIAAVQLKLKNSTRTIEWATAALEAQFTEDGIIVAFGGNRQAVDTDAIKNRQSHTYYARASGHWIRADYKACIRDCDKALDLSEFVEGYFLRGRAKCRNGDDAVEDFVQVVNGIDAHTSDSIQKDMLEIAQKGIEGKCE
jgi:tetratricopeptide (TPR) repeat protein